MIDTLKLAQGLEGAGMPRPQAEQIAGTLNESLKDPLGRRLERIEMEVVEIRGDVRVMKWGIGVSLAGIVSLVVKAFFP